MKTVHKYIIIILVLLIAAIAVTIGLLSLYGYLEPYDDTINGTFSIDDERFRYIIDSGRYTVDVFRNAYKQCKDLKYSVGPVENAAIARKEASKILPIAMGLDIVNEKPWRVLYDETNGVWCVCGDDTRFKEHSSSKATLTGGVVHILIEEKTGNIIAIWHDA